MLRTIFRPLRRLGLRRPVLRRAFSSDAKRTLPAWATVDPYAMGIDGTAPAQGANYVDGKWSGSRSTIEIIDPVRGGTMVVGPDTQLDETARFVKGMRATPKSGLHNPLRNPERYVMLGDLTERAAAELSDPVVNDFFTKLIQRTVGKHTVQCAGEVNVVQKWLASFSGDNVRQLARGFGLPGDRAGQESRGYRFPFGPVAVITPFNFPFEIPMIQTLSALYMGNRPTVKVDQKVQIVFEQGLRMLLALGLPPTDIDFLWADGPVCESVLKEGGSRMTLFTGSQKVADRLTVELGGRVKLEDAGFDWKILGPDVSDLDYVAWQCDQDAYAFSGQKCSAQSILFMHSNWREAGILPAMEARAAMRNFQDLSSGPVLTWPNERIQAHLDSVLQIDGAKVVFGGRPLQDTTIPPQYGSWEPTAVFVPLKEMLKDGNFEVATTELFGPFQVVTEYNDSEIDLVIEACERMDSHLTAAVVSNDYAFQNRVLGSTVNGTSYAGIRARTTGAPQNHWFGPSSDPRSAGIHTTEAIQLVWSGHREVIIDTAAVEENWTAPKPT